MNNFRFESPNWSAAFWVVLVVFTLLFWLLRRRATVLSQLVSVLMQSRLVRQPSMLRRILVPGMYAAATVCFVVALMRPQFGMTTISTPNVGAQLMFCLDVSKSMLAEDVAPNRLERAKADITDLLSFLDGDQVGLIAFAGRASVLCPMTTDYGFFRLILDGAGPNSVGRGGTSLEEPLRKAIDGYRDGGDVSRVIVLITDGEDHDSRPLDAADEARQRGIRIVAVGLGDEAGSEIRITDPQTGATERLRDQDGSPVVSRLDGQTLRELALKTEGVYIPAGTGRLDLKSIYETHLQPLVRDELESERRVIRREAFQWAIVAGLILTVLALMIGSRPAAVSDTTAIDAANGDGKRVVSAILFTVALYSVALFSHEAAAANPETASLPKVASEAEIKPPGSEVPESVPVRQIYNDGLELLQGTTAEQIDKAETLLTAARDRSDSDGEVRYRATYNLGWVAVRRADANVENAPEQALQQLQQASSWFRDAIRIRPESEAARQNLEVVLKRIIQLRDQITKQNEGDLLEQITTMIETVRGQLNQLRGLVQQVTKSDDPNIVDRYRAEFNRFAVEHRVTLSDLEGLIELAADEIQTLQTKDDTEKTPEDAVREMQLQASLEHLGAAGQRLGSARNQLRRRQAMRAFRRANASLAELKRAREQLLEPLEVLDGILADCMPLARETAAIALHQPDTPLPAWIDQDYLAENQVELSTRTGELTSRLQAGVDAANTSSVSTADHGQDGAEDPGQKEMIEQIGRALPHLVTAVDQMRQSENELAAPLYQQSLEHQVNSIAALQQAREQFADLRTLIELTSADQSMLRDGLGQIKELESTGTANDPAEESSEETSSEEVDSSPVMPSEEELKELLQAVSEKQSKNIVRADRIAGMIAKELEALQQAANTPQEPTPGSDPSAQDDQAAEQEIQRYELASELIGKVANEMNAAVTAMNDPAAEEDPVEEQASVVSDAFDHANAAAESLDELRRLFFTLIEHLRETAKKQAELNDETQESVGTESDQDNSASQFQQLGKKQADLSQVSNELASAFEQQAQQQVQQPSPDEDTQQPEQQAQQQEMAEKQQQAAELIRQGSQLMDQAVTEMNSESDSHEAVLEPQGQALQKLFEALQLLQPPQNNDQNQDQNDQQQQDQSQQEQQQNQQQQQQGQQQMDPSRVLQAVRDREAQRRKERERTQNAGQVPVEKDW
ncbi:VWA domain-containing protein [Rhodopirellula sp. MGV]|uniref:VWA domain-containing protein n=1 Tax=Rhodopirellula sp. MGV TaxID=2023130 RepID=UPI000B965689|nr:VWA domain-containing protein [Rhodopirellula sp. MGV]OYP38142.1 hypothetical protein CGZ80_02610 [Rhodopirellula sp. MGV]PNY38479.1 VWA domain-containing protein [Rhodopirellula baltica]